MKTNRELAELGNNIEVALHYDKGDILALSEKVELLHIISFRNQVDYNTENDRKIFNNIADKLLDIAVSSYSVIEGNVIWIILSVVSKEEKNEFYL